MSVNIEDDTKNFVSMLKSKIDVQSKKYPSKLLISGMGGSGIGGRILETLASYERLGEIFAWNNYGIPAWLSSNDNVICISYSGNTAETLPN